MVDSTEPAEANEVAKPCLPIEANQPVGSTELADPIKPAGPTNPVEGAKSSKEVGQTPLGRSTQLSEVTEPIGRIISRSD